MTALKSLSLGALAAVAMAGSTHAASVTSWRWTVWSPSQGIVPVTLSTSPTSTPIVSTPTVQPIDSNSWQGQNSWATPSTAVAAAPAAAMIPTSADAYLNMGNGPYPDAAQLTTGAAQPWYNSPVVDQLFHGTPDAQQRADFTNTVFQRVEQTYQQSGVPLQLTTDPNIPAAHTLSVVSGTSYAANPNAVGITNVGENGFSFIDKFAGAQSVDQLEWLVAHNVAHELMHAFGGEHHDTTGQYLDSGITSWSTMISPTTVFSQAAVQDLLSKNFRAGLGATSATGAELVADGQELGPHPVPEPATLLVWGLGVTAVAAGRRVRVRCLAA